MDVTQIVNLGACQLQASTNNFSTYVDLGDTDEAGAKLSVKTSVIEAKVARFGDTPVAGWINGQIAEIDVTLTQTQYTILGQIIPGATINTSSGGLSNMTLGVAAGTKLSAFSLKMKPLLSGLSPLYDVTAVNVITVGAFEVTLSGKKEQVWKVKLAVLVNQNALNGANLLTIGDTTITQAAAVTVTSTTPANKATGVADNGTVVWAFSGNINSNSVSTTGNQPTVGVFEDPGQSSSITGNKVAGTAVVSGTGASTIITFTPTSSFGATVKYYAYLSGIVDAYGNVLPLQTIEFTTT